MFGELGKKVLSIVLVVMLIASLTACNGNESTKETTKSGSDSSTKEVSAEKESTPKEKVTITYWHIFPEGDAFKPVHDKLIKDFNESQDEVYVEDLGISFFDYLSKMDTSIPAGTGPDVGFNSLSDNTFRAESGVLVNLDQYIEADGFDVSEFYSSALSNVTYDGSVYGMPFAWGTRMLVYNKDMFREAGLDPESPPTTLAQLEEYADKLTQFGDNDEIKVMGFHPTLGNVNYFDYLLMRGGETFDENGDPVVNSAKNLETLEWYVRMTNKYGAEQAQSLQAGSQTTGIDPFLAGYVAMEINVNDFYKKLGDSDIDYGISAIPKLADGGVRTSVGEGFCLEAFDYGDAARAEAAWKFISYMASVEAQQYWAVENKWLGGNQKAMENIEEMEADANWQSMITELAYATPDNYIANARAWKWVIMPEVQAAQLEIKTPKEALDAAQAAVELLIEDYNATN